MPRTPSALQPTVKEIRFPRGESVVCEVLCLTVAVVAYVNAQVRSAAKIVLPTQCRGL